MRRLVLLLLAAAAAAQGVPEGVGIEQRLGARLPRDARFVDAAGGPVRLGDLLGERPVIVALVYYECPQLCTLVLNGLARCLKAVTFDAGDQFDVVAISIDPGETPALAREKKESYLRLYGREGTDAGWRFLVGKEPAIRAVANAVGYRYRYDPARDEYAHAAGIVVATPDGRLSRYFFGVEYAPRDVRLGLVEASGGEIGSVVDAILLFCFHYDPASGTYGLAILNAVRLGGGLTVLLLLFFVVRWLRRDRAREAG